MNPDVEVVGALRPAMATIPNALLIGIGSPYRRSGVMYDAWKRHFGKNDSSTLVVQASSQQLNPTIPQSIIDRAMETDPIAAQAEWFATFRSDLAAFLDLDLIERAIEPECRERAPRPSLQYHAFCDPSGGAHDSFTLAIAHAEGNRMMLDLCRGVKPPFDPSAVVQEYAAVLKSYRCYSVVGDRYSGQWVVEAFSKEGIDYRHSELSKSEIYLESLPLFAQGVVDLLDSKLLLLELQSLERRTGRAGRDSVDHPPGGRDDLSNSCCGALVHVAQRDRHTVSMYNFVTGRPLTARQLWERGLG